MRESVATSFPRGIPMGKPGAMKVLDMNEEHPSQVFYHSVREKTILHDSIATRFSSWR